jgi:ribosomal protein L11 methyltransferase
VSVYLEIQGNLPEDAEDQLAESLSSSRILGVQVVPQSAGRIDVAVWVEPGDDRVVEQVRSVLKALDSGAVCVREHPDEDWSAEWREGLRAFEVGHRWWIDPDPDRATAAPDGRLRLAVEPRAAFGSGTHESTQLVLMELEERDCRSLRVLDIGTGSGVLAIAAERLGAASVFALDIDHVAAWEARTTARCQSWRCRPRVVAGGIDCLGDVEFDLVLCNMIMSRFNELLGGIRQLLSSKGTVIFSGILDSERIAVEGMLEGSGMAVVGDRELRGWISVSAIRSGPAP